MEIDYLMQIGSVKAKGKDYIKGSKSASNIEIKLTDGTIQKVKAYVFGHDIYSCLESGNRWKCGKQQLEVSLSRDAQIDVFDGLFKKGAIIFGRDVVEKTINNITCKEVLWSADISRLSQEEKYFAVSASGIASNSDIDQLSSNLKSFGMAQCVTNQGVEILQDITAEADTNKINSKIEVTSFKINQPIDDNVFAVPDGSIN